MAEKKMTPEEMQAAIEELQGKVASLGSDLKRQKQRIKEMDGELENKEPISHVCGGNPEGG